MRFHPFVFLPERMRTACDRSGANGNGASSRGTRRTDNARGQLETRRFLCWTEDVAAQSERRASLLAFPSQSCVGAANRLQAYMERGDEGSIAAYYNYTADVQQALLKAYDEQNSSEVLPPTRKSNSYLSSKSRKSATGSPAFFLSPYMLVFSPLHDAGA